MYREDFPILKNNVVYFDNAATTLKPKCVVDAVNDYYLNYSANIHRADYYMSFKASDLYENTREIVRDFINAKKREEIVFTSGTTDAINLIVNGFFSNILGKGDEVILSKSEHASLILPFTVLSLKKGFTIKYVNLDDSLKLNLYSLKKLITSKTKVIALAGITNVVGDIRDLKSICSIAKKNRIYTLIDGAQLVPHLDVNVQKIDCDFLCFSAHKMCGPTGVGVLYGKYELLNRIFPQKVGGGMNENFKENELYLKKVPTRLEAGTPNIEGVIGLGAAVKYLKSIGMKKIVEYESDLRRYLINSLNQIPYIQIYNEESEAGIVTITVNSKEVSDVALYLNKNNICVRAGNHCSKMLKDEIGIENTIRISLYFYNTFEEIDYLKKVLADKDELYSF